MKFIDEEFKLKLCLLLMSVVNHGYRTQLVYNNSLI